MFDAHVHLQDPRLRGWLPDALNAAETAGIRGMCCCATSPADVAEVQALPREWRQIRIARGFGIHPWHAGSLATTWLNTLEAALLQDPGACVGEVGLDGVRDVSPARQRQVLEAQLELAVRLQRVVVLHGARAFGELTAVMKNYAPRLPGFMLHSFSGSLELTRDNLKLGAMLSFSGNICDPRNTKARGAAQVVPPQQLLVETDAPDFFPPGGLTLGADGLNHPANLPLVIRTLAQIRAVAEPDLCHATEFNARHFFSGT